MNQRPSADEIVHTTAGLFRVQVWHAPDENSSPRENHHASLARLVLSHPRFSLPREGEIADRIAEAFERLDNFEDVARWLRVYHGASVVLPVWAYEPIHNIKIRLGTSDGESAETGQLVGLVYDDPRVHAESGPAESAKTTAALAEAVDKYDQWLNGELYAHRVLRLVDAGPQDQLDFETQWRWVAAHHGFYSITEAMAHGKDAVHQMVVEPRKAPEPFPHPYVATLAVRTECRVGDHAATIGTTTITDIEHTISLAGNDREWRGSCSCGNWTTAEPMRHKASIRRAHACHVQAADTYVASVDVFVSPMDGAVVVELDTSSMRDVPARVFVNGSKVVNEVVEA